MKHLPAYALLFSILFAQPIYAEKSPIVDVVIANDLADFYERTTSAIYFRFIKKDGTSEYTRGYGDGRISWPRISARSKQATIGNGRIYVNMKHLRANDYKIDIDLFVTFRGQDFQKTIQYALPRITSIEIVQDIIVPYTWYGCKVKINTTAKSYYFFGDHRTAAFATTDFVWTLDKRFNQRDNLFRYEPSPNDRAKTIRIQVVNEKLGLQDIVDVPLQQVQKKSFVFAPKPRAAGENGEDGEDGDTGENGGSSGGGWHGADGYEGKHAELVITKYGADKIIFALYLDGNKEVYYLPTNSKISLQLPGGRGGDGGDGGSSSDEYDAGSTGYGGPGGNGGNGGQGGYIHVYSDLEISMLSRILDIQTPGGLPGNGGRGGDGSPSGTGGKAGNRGKRGSVNYEILST
jgi:hypothetical protein